MGLGKVTVWKMTEEERLAYIKKHPIRPTKKAKKRTETLPDVIDYSWRGKKAAESRWGDK